MKKILLFLLLIVIILGLRWYKPRIAKQEPVITTTNIFEQLWLQKNIATGITYTINEFNIVRLMLPIKDPENGDIFINFSLQEEQNTNKQASEFDTNNITQGACDGNGACGERNKAGKYYSFSRDWWTTSPCTYEWQTFPTSESICLSAKTRTPEQLNNIHTYTEWVMANIIK